MTTNNDQFVPISKVLSGDVDGVTVSVGEMATLMEKGVVGYLDDYGRQVSLSGNTQEVEILKAKGLDLLSWLFRVAQSRTSPETDDLAKPEDVAWVLVIHAEELVGIGRFGWFQDQLPDFDQLTANVPASSDKMPGNKRVKSLNTLICALASMAGLSLKDASEDYELIAKHIRSINPPVVNLQQKRTVAKVLEEAYFELN